MNPLLRFLYTLIGSATFVFVLYSRPNAHESPVDHVERTLRFSIVDGKFVIRYRLQITERAALLQLHRMDTDRNGSISINERDAFFNAFRDQLSAQLKFEMDGQPVRLSSTTTVKLDAEFGQTFVFSAPMRTMASGKHSGKLVDEYSREFPGAYRVHVDENAKNAAKVVLQFPNANPVAQEHPGVMIVNFDVVVP